LPEDVLNAHDADPSFDEYYALLKNPDVLYSMIEEAKKFPDKSGEELIEFHDGRIVEVRSSHYNILNEYGGRVWFFRDITEKMSTENALVERNFELDSFVYRASHDLKAPLNSVMGLIEIMQGETDPENQKLYLNLMNRSVVKLDAFIRNLADFSRNRRTGIAQTMIEFPEMVSGAIEQLSFMEGADQVRFEKVVEIHGDFYSDPVRLQVILDNLLSNAIKYRDGGRQDRWVKVYVKVSPQEAVMEVSDNGIGIEADQHQKVFRMFYRAHVQAYGAGLGLYIVQQAVRALKGQISLESAPGVGTTVRVTIPATIQW
jgi:signal transduction histidine kinase